jgi:hypothetical protein
MIVGALGICLIMVASLPVNYHPWRHQAFLFVGKDDFSETENLVITSLFLASCMGVAIVFPDITSVLSILGGLCSCTMSYLIPMLAYVKSNNDSLLSCRNLAPILFFSTLTVIGYISVGITVYLLYSG